MKVLEGVIEIDCQMVVVRKGVDIDIGANASAEEGEEELEDGSETVNNVVNSFRLQSTTFDKKHYTIYLKGYMKAVKAKIQEAAAKDSKDADAIVKAFETSAATAAKKILGNFKDYEVKKSAFFFYTSPGPCSKPKKFSRNFFLSFCPSLFCVVLRWRVHEPRWCCHAPQLPRGWYHPLLHCLQGWPQDHQARKFFFLYVMFLSSVGFDDVNLSPTDESLFCSLLTVSKHPCTFVSKLHK